MPQPGWHPDPSGAHEWRYWDGTAWTAQVADGGVVGHDDPAAPARAVAASASPAAPARAVAASASPAAPVVNGAHDASAGAHRAPIQPAGPGRGTVLDTEIAQWPQKPRRLWMDERTFGYGDTVVPLAAVTAVAYKVTKVYVNGVPSTTTYEFHLWASQQHVKVSFSAASLRSRQTKADREDDYRRLVTASSMLIEPRITEDLFAGVARGETVQAGGVEVSRAGVTRPGLRAKRLTWDEVAGTDIAEGDVRILTHHPRGGAKAAVSVSMVTPNAVVLPPLLAACVRARRQARPGAPAANA